MTSRIRLFEGAPAFPTAVLARDLQRLGLTPFRASQDAGLGGFSTVKRWLDGTTTPRGRELRRLIEALGLDRAPYDPYLEHAATAEVTLACPACGRRRPLPRARLKFAARQMRGRHELRALGDGVYELPCRPCTAREKAQRILPDRNAARLKKRLGYGAATYLLDARAEGDPEAAAAYRREMVALMGARPKAPSTRAQLLEAAKRPKGLKHRHAIAVSNVVARSARLHQAFHLCPLCKLAVYKQTWHQRCWTAWRGWHHRTLGRRPTRADVARWRARIQRRGPDPEQRLGRNYAWLIARRSGRATLAQLVSRDGDGSGRATAAKGIAALLRLLPGSWDLVFKQGRRADRANRIRQELVPLPLEIHPWVEEGERDPLIGRLLEFRMPEAQIAELTGASVARVQGLRRRLGERRPPAERIDPQGQRLSAHRRPRRPRVVGEC